MKNKILYSVAGLMLFSACKSQKTVQEQLQNRMPICGLAQEAEVKNTLPFDRHEVVSVPFPTKISGTPLVYNEKNEEVPSQITYDKKLIFWAEVPANGVSHYTIKSGTPKKFPNTTQGRQYPERLDDMAWENDVMGYRAYGPALQAKGETSYGYDLFAKHTSDKPILDIIYEKELDHKTRKRSKELKETNPEESLWLWRSISYHYDRGQGLDVYSVGPTLGAGVTALMQGDEIIYPYCYKEYEILDNGPLRFTVKLTFTPTKLANGKEVVEQRVISLDKGSQLNKTEITYKGLDKAHTIGSGIVLHDTPQRIDIAPNQRYMAYVDPTNTEDKSNGQIFVGMVFPKPAKEIKTLPFDEAKQKKIKAYGHLIAKNEYKPNKTFTYYWGAGWTKSTIPNREAWVNYLKNFEQAIDHPLQVTVK